MQANQPGDNAYNPAPAVTRVLRVGAVPQTLEFAALGRAMYGDLPVRLPATASSGLAPSFAVVSGPGQIVGIN